MLIRGERIRVRRKGGTETITVEISKCHPGGFGAAYAKDITSGFQILSLEKHDLWKDNDGDYWVQIEEDE